MSDKTGSQGWDESGRGEKEKKEVRKGETRGTP